MDKNYLKFESGRTFLITPSINLVRKGRHPYIVFFDIDKLKTYFRLNIDINSDKYDCFYLRPTKEGIEHITNEDKYFYVSVCDMSEFGVDDESFFEMLDSISKKHGYMVLSEEPSKGQKAIEINSNSCGVFYSIYNGKLFPISYSPFNYWNIDIENKSNIQALSFGDEHNFTVSYLEDSKMKVSPNLNELENFYDFEEMDRQINGLMGHLQIKNINLIRNYNNFSFISNYLRRFPTVQKIEHIYSHLASVMLDNGCEKENGIGVVYDSISYATNGRMQGSEFIFGSPGNFKKVGKWKSVQLPGGDIANIEPWRISLAIIKEAVDGSFYDIDIPFMNNIKNNESSKYIIDAISKDYIDYSPSSSMHHIIAALGELLWYQETTFDMSYFEDLFSDIDVDNKKIESYKVAIFEEEELSIIDTNDFFSKLITAILAREDMDTIAAKALMTIARATADNVDIIAKTYNEKKVFLAGDFFTHTSFLKTISNELENRDYEVFISNNIPVDDSAISVGQLINFINQESK